MSARPNILILMADSLRFDVPGFMGDPVCRTPHLDRLARDAVVFDNAYAPSPVCVPCRQSMASGLLPVRSGCRHFGEDLPPGSRTFARRLAEIGYYTVACGKLHHRGPDQMQGWLHRIGSDCASAWPDTTGASGREEIGRFKWRGREDLDEAGPGDSPNAAIDAHAVDGAISLLSGKFGPLPVSAGGREAPLCVMVSLQQPHFPFLAEPPLFSHYRERVRPRLAEVPFAHPVLGAGALAPSAEVSARSVQDATAAYYAMVESADRQFGRVVDGMARAGFDIDDWVVVFCSDHGEMLGEHALWGKRQFFEGSVRVPLFVRAPRRFARARRRENVNLVDLFPTLCELAQADVPRDLDGRSLVPELRGEPADPGRESASQLGENHFLLKRGHLKYLAFGDSGPDVLFDLASDPGESVNRIADPAYARQADQLRTRIHHIFQ